MTKTNVISFAAAWLCAHICVTLMLAFLLIGTPAHQHTPLLQVLILSKSLALAYSLPAALLRLLAANNRTSITVLAILTDAALVFYLRGDSGPTGLAAGFLVMLIPCLALTCTSVFCLDSALRRFQSASSTAA